MLVLVNKIVPHLFFLMTFIKPFLISFDSYYCLLFFIILTFIYISVLIYVYFFPFILFGKAKFWVILWVEILAKNTFDRCGPKMADFNPFESPPHCSLERKRKDGRIPPWGFGFLDSVSNESRSRSVTKVL